MHPKSPSLRWKDTEEALLAEAGDDAAALRRALDAEADEPSFLERLLASMAPSSEVRHEARALLLLGPSGAGKCHCLRQGLVSPPPGALQLNRAAVCRVSEAWEAANRLAAGGSAPRFARQLAERLEALLVEVLRRAVASRANVVVATADMGVMTTLHAAGYDVACAGVYADRVACMARGGGSERWRAAVEAMLEVPELLSSTAAPHGLDAAQLRELLLRDRQLAVERCWGECRLLAGVYKARDGLTYEMLPWSMAEEMSPEMQLLVVEGKRVRQRVMLRLQLEGSRLVGEGSAWRVRLQKGRPQLESEGGDLPSLEHSEPVAGWSIALDEALLESLGSLDFCNERLRALTVEEFEQACEASGLAAAPARQEPKALILLSPSGGGKTTLLRRFAEVFGMREAEAVVVESKVFREAHAQYAAILQNGQANGSVWFRAWPAAKEVVAAGKAQLLERATEARKDIILSETGADLQKLLKAIAALREKGYAVSICGIFAEPAEILARGVARELQEGKRYNRDMKKIEDAFAAFVPAVAAANGRFCLVRNNQNQSPLLYQEGLCGQHIQFSLKEALRDVEEVSIPPSDLAYLMEGNMNVVMSYRGVREDWQGCVLRCRKGDSSQYRDDSIFARQVAARLFGSEHVDPGRLVRLTSENVRDIDDAMAAHRPAKRRSKGLDADARGEKGILAMRVQDLTAAPAGLHVVTVELKPKCGLVERRGLPCRYQLLQQQKLLQGKIKRVSAFDPVKLLSGNASAAKEALEAAFAEPQNNLRIFLDGELLFSEEVKVEGLEEKLAAADLPSVEGLFALLAEALSSRLTQSLKRAQAWAAGETSYVAKQLYSWLRFELGGPVADKALARVENFETALEGLDALPCDETGIDAAVAAMNRAHEMACNEPWTEATEAEVIKQLCRFLLGRTAHDVSVLFSFVRASAESSQALEAARFRAIGEFFVRSCVVDTDVKSAGKIPEYSRQLDEAAAAYYRRFDPLDEDEDVDLAQEKTGVVPETAMGGHVGAISFEGELVWKRDQGGQRGRTELDFLRWALDEPSCTGIIPELVGYRRDGNVAALGMQNLLHTLQAPAVLDVKLGTRTWNTSALAHKAAAQSQKAADTTTGSLGVRVVAGRFRRRDGAFCKLGAKSWDVVDLEGLRALFSEFLCSEALRESAKRKLEEIRDWWTNQVWFAFYGSSLLLAYDTEARDECRIRLIDFANCERIAEKAQDLSGVARGFETLLNLFEVLSPLP